MKISQPKDINRVKKNGRLILPLSIAALNSYQSPKEVYEFLKFFEPKVPGISADVILLYSNGLYFNTEEISLNMRKKILNKTQNHVNELFNIIQKNGKFVESAFHIVSWDHILLNFYKFSEFSRKIHKRLEDDKELLHYIKKDLKGRPATEANVSFIIEESIVTHLMRQRQITFPTTLANSDTAWNLIAYPGKYIATDAYIHNKGLLPKNNSLDPKDLFHQGVYNASEKVFQAYNNVLIA